MRVGLQGVLPGLLCALLAGGCGETKAPPSTGAASGSAGEEPSAGSGGVPSAGGAASSAGTSAAGASTQAGSSSAGDPAGSGQGQAGRGGSGGTASCEPEGHERPEPGALTSTFASLASDLAGIYAIEDVYDKGTDCTSMCRTGAVVDPRFRKLAFLIVAPAGESYDISACKSAADCTSADGIRARIGRVDAAKSDQILFSELTYVQNPQGQTCTGGTDDTWLIATAPGKIRVDLEQVRVEFAPYFSDVSQLYGCDSGDALEAARNAPCNGLSVIDATRVE
jgi:hypothetical protein